MIFHLIRLSLPIPVDRKNLPVTASCVVMALLFLSSSALEAASKKRLAKLHETYARTSEKTTTQLNQLAERMDTSGFNELAEETRQLAQPVNLTLQPIGNYPREILPEIDSGLPKQQAELLKEQRRFRVKHAGALYKLTRMFLKEGDPRFAFALLQEVLRFNPDHQTARKLMGFRQSGKLWITPFEAKMAREKKIWHKKFGWIPETYKDRYEAGERNYGGKWIPAARENEIRRDFNKAWQIKSEHFLVKTNKSLERGVAISQKLEEYYDFFHKTYYQFFTTPQQIEMLFDGKTIKNYANLHEVHYYRNKQEYVDRLKKQIPTYVITDKGERIPQVAMTNGLYYTSERTSYFYFDPKADNDATMYHEATHQLFFEPTHPAKRFNRNNQHLVGLKRFFWTIEGIACYMESTTPDGESFAIGNVDSDRFYQARYRFLNDGYYIPLRKFSSMGMNEFKNHPRIAQNYSQSSGLSHFFMEYDGGKYRTAFIEHLSQLYTLQGRQTDFVQSLETLTGVSYEELDRQYAQHMKQMEQAAKGKTPFATAISE